MQTLKSRKKIPFKKKGKTIQLEAIQLRKSKKLDLYKVKSRKVSIVDINAKNEDFFHSMQEKYFEGMSQISSEMIFKFGLN